MAKKRIEWIDCVRAFGMMLIIASHTYVVGYWSNLIFTVNVAIFFVLSGYLTKPKTISQTVQKGFYTLIVPYLATVLIMFLLSLISARYQVPGMFPTDHWYHYLVAGLYGIGSPTNQSIVPGVNVPAIGAIWFLLAMYIGNIIYQFLMKIRASYDRNMMTLFLITSSALLAWLAFAISPFIRLPWSINSALLSISFYTTGYVIRQYNLIQPRILTALLALLGLILWLSSARVGSFSLNRAFADQPFIGMAGAIGGCYFLMYLFKLIDTMIPMHGLARLGNLALITLAFHIIGLNLFNDVAILGNKLFVLGLAPQIIGFIQICYRIVISELATVILAKFSWVRKIFAIR